MPEGRIIYGDGKNEVSVLGDQVAITQVGEHDDGTMVLTAIHMSHDAFREVVLGWQRLRETEKEAEK